MHLTEIFPDAAGLLVLPPEDVVPIALRLVKERAGNGKVHSQQLLEQVNGPPGRHEVAYPYGQKIAAEKLLNETWTWMLRHGLLIPEPGPNGANGWHTLSDEAEKIAAGADMAQFIQGAQFPKSLLHPSIANDVWRELMRGEFDNATLKCFRAVEEAVRAAALGAPKPYGTDLMRFAFNPKGGPLADAAEEFSEAEALAHVFAGAIGRFKNPQSHRTVKMDGRAARELAVFASHLLYIVEERAKRP